MKLSSGTTSPTTSSHLWFKVLIGCLLFPGSSTLAADTSPVPPPKTPIAFPQNLSLKNEVEHAVDRGLGWLRSNQNSNGWWSTPDQPAVTALALAALKGDPKGRYQSNEPRWLKNGYDFLLGSVQPDGGIHRSNLVTYNTSISMMALLAAKDSKYDPILRRARQFLVGLQRDFGIQGQSDDVLDGGIGYGSKYEHSDMGNTLAALEALYYSKPLSQDQNPAGFGDLNWAAAIQFLQNCQNLPAYNKQKWASNDTNNLGGFIYYPGHSMAGAQTNGVTGRVALRSYGSISYGGMLSYLYAELKREDPRVVAVFDWLRRNYTLEENPGMGPQGFYFYLHTMTKALTAYGVDELQLEEGRKVSWRKDVALRLIDLQQSDGSWLNQNGRWWEKDPALVTSYAVLSLEMIWRSL